MNINWSVLAQSEIYKLMKYAMTKEGHRFSYDARYPEAFAFAINRAKQYIYVSSWLKDHDYTDDLIFQLTSWEQKRKQSFLSFYSDYSLPKKSTRILKTPGVRSRIKYYKKDSWYKNSHRAAEELSQHLKKLRTKKARWNTQRKADAKYWRDIEAQRGKNSGYYA